MTDKPSLQEIAKQLSEKMQCTCDLDNWEPEANTGHSCVCGIHKKAIHLYRIKGDHND